MWVTTEDSIHGSLNNLALIVAACFIDLSDEDCNVWNNMKILHQEHMI